MLIGFGVPNVHLIRPLKKSKSNLTMKKGNTLTLLVLALEITTIVVLHALRINHSEKAVNKEISRNISADQPDSRSRSTYSLAVFK